MSAKLYQQVNLYQPIFRRQQRFFSAQSMLQSLAVIAIAFVTVYAYGRLQLNDLETEAALLANREDAYVLQLASLDTSSSMSRRADIERSLEDLNKSLESQQQLIDALDRAALGTATGFSAKLAALGRRHTAPLWLTALHLDGNTRSVELSGRSTNPDLVPRYLLGLGDEPALAGQRFDLFEIRRSETGEGVEFQVSSRVEQP